MSKIAVTISIIAVVFGLLLPIPAGAIDTNESVTESHTEYGHQASLVESNGEWARQYATEMLEKHYKYTKSDKARELLDDFERYEPFFWLVVPAASNIQDLLKATTANAA